MSWNIHTRSKRTFPKMLISFKEAVALPEYSATVPTGVVLGKMWRRYDGDFDPDCPPHQRQWLIGRYEEVAATIKADGSRQEMCRAVFYRPVIRVKAVTESAS